MNLRSAIGMLAVPAWVLACSGRSIEVGPGDTTGGAGNSSSGAASGAAASSNGAAGFGGSAGAANPAPVWPEPSACVPSSDLPAVVGSWTGYIENQDAPWDKLTLSVRGASLAGGVCGTLVIGAGAPPAPPTDPSLDYPSEAYNHPEVIPGYAQTLLKGTTAGTRLRFSINLVEAWKNWCPLLTSHAAGTTPESYGCAPPGAIQVSDSAGKCRVLLGSEPVALSCASVFMCAEACSCNVAGCTGLAPDSHVKWADTDSLVGFDLLLSGNQASGSATRNPGFHTFFSKAP